MLVLKLEIIDGIICDAYLYPVEGAGNRYVYYVGLEACHENKLR